MRTLISVLLMASFALTLVTTGLATIAPSTFDASDGNLRLNDVGEVPGGGSDAKDWENAPRLRKTQDLPSGQTDNSFSQGTKEDTINPSIDFGSVPNNKSDLNRFYVSNEKVDGKAFLYLGWTRKNTLGTANMDFEFNQSELVTSNGVTPQRTAGDMLITYDFASGGKKVELGLSLWTETGTCQASGAKAPCWGPIVDLDAQGYASGTVNDGFSVFNPIDSETLADKTFGEAEINLAAAGVFGDSVCRNFGRAYLKSRSSDSFTAALKDFIAPIPIELKNCGTIRIHKQTNPDQAAEQFGFTTSGGLNPATFNLSDDGTRTYTNVLSGSYTFAENDPSLAGFDLSSIECVKADGSTIQTDLANRRVTIGLAAEDTVDCTFTNTKRGSITIVKNTVPNDAQDFAFTGDLGPFSLDDDSDPTLPNSRTFSSLLPGSYAVSEGPVTGWDLTDLDCDDDGSAVPSAVSGATATIAVDPGEHVTCTFENTKRGSITIIKDAVPNHAQDFSYTASAALGGFALDDDNEATLSNTRTFSNVAPGSYTVAETAVSGWDLTSLTCVDSDSSGTASRQNSANAMQADITVDPGENVTCTFVNTARGSITIVKDALPDDAQDFSYTAGSGLSGFTLDDDGGADATYANTRTFANVVAGRYTVTEGATSGWDLTDLACNDSNSSGDIASRTATINVEPGELVTCTFENTKRATISIHKQDDAGSPIAGAVFTLYIDNDPSHGPAPHGSEDTATTMTCTSDANGNCSITSVVPGPYWVVETTVPADHAPAADQWVEVTAGYDNAANPLVFVNNRLFTKIVLVCHGGELYASSVIEGQESRVSLAGDGLTAEQQAAICGLGGARFENNLTGTHTISIAIGAVEVANGATNE